jgi:hypothetical protein
LIHFDRWSSGLLRQLYTRIGSFKALAESDDITTVSGWSGGGVMMVVSEIKRILRSAACRAPGLGRTIPNATTLLNKNEKRKTKNR